jgi:hypothetical protein
METMKIKDRITGLKRIKAADLRPHPQNWRIHTQAQREALQGLLCEVGYADALIARQLPDKSYQLLDGHLRAETTPNTRVPVLVVDLDDEEAAKLLASLDSLAAMAGSDPTQLDALLAGLKTDSAALSAIWEGMTSKVAEAIAPVEFKEIDESIETAYCCPKCGYRWSGSPGGVSDDVNGEAHEGN